MKKLITLALAALAAIAAQAANSFLRVDINATDQQIALTKPYSDCMVVSPMNWIKNAENRKYTLSASMNDPLSESEWEDFSFSFTPEKAGKLRVSICGQWAKEEAERGWLLIDSITVNGKLIANGDFKQTYTGQYGKVIPKKFALDPGSKVLYIPDGGKEKTPAVKVNHDHRLFFNRNHVRRPYVFNRTSAHNYFIFILEACKIIDNILGIDFANEQRLTETVVVCKPKCILLAC